MTADAQENPGEAQARRLETVYEQLAALLRQPEVAQRLRAAPGENEWSAMQTVGHMAEMIPIVEVFIVAHAEEHLAQVEAALGI